MEKEYDCPRKVLRAPPGDALTAQLLTPNRTRRLRTDLDGVPRRNGFGCALLLKPRVTPLPGSLRKSAHRGRILSVR